MLFIAFSTYFLLISLKIRLRACVYEFYFVNLQSQLLTFIHSVFMGLFDLLSSKKEKEKENNDLSDYLEYFYKPEDHRPHIYFSQIEVIDILHIAMYIANSFGDFRKEEGQTIVYELKRLGFQPGTQKYAEMIDYAATHRFDSAVKAFCNMSYQKRKYAIGFWAELIESDHEISRGEKELLSTLAQAINHPGDSFAKERGFWTFSTPHVDMII